MAGRGAEGGGGASPTRMPVLYRVVLAVAIVGFAWIGYLAFRGAGGGNGDALLKELRALSMGDGSRERAGEVLRVLVGYAGVDGGTGSKLEGKLPTLHRGGTVQGAGDVRDRRALEASLWDLYRRAFVLGALRPMVLEASDRLDAVKGIRGAGELERFRAAVSDEAGLQAAERGGALPPEEITGLVVFMTEGASEGDARAWSDLGAAYRALFLAAHGGVGTSSWADFPASSSGDGWAFMGLPHAFAEDGGVSEVLIERTRERLRSRLAVLNEAWPRVWSPSGAEWVLGTIRGSDGRARAVPAAMSDWWLAFGLDAEYLAVERGLRARDAELAGLEGSASVLEGWNAPAEGWSRAFQRLHAAYVLASAKVAAGVVGRPAEAREALQRDWSSFYVEMEAHARAIAAERLGATVAEGRSGIEAAWGAFEPAWKGVFESAANGSHALGVRVGGDPSQRALILMANDHHQNRQNMAFLVAQSLDPFSEERLGAAGWKGPGPWSDVVVGDRIRLGEAEDPRAVLASKVKALQGLASPMDQLKGAFVPTAEERAARSLGARVALTRAMGALAGSRDLGVADAAKRGAPAERDRFDGTAIDGRYGRGSLARGLRYAGTLADWSGEVGSALAPVTGTAAEEFRAGVDRAASAYVRGWWGYWTEGYGGGLKGLAADSAKRGNPAQAFAAGLGPEAGDRLAAHALRGLAAFAELRTTMVPSELPAAAGEVGDRSRQAAVMCAGNAQRVIDEVSSAEGFGLSADAGEIGRLRSAARGMAEQAASLGGSEPVRWREAEPDRAAQLRAAVAYFAYTPATSGDSGAAPADLRPGFGPLALIGAAIVRELDSAPAAVERPEAPTTPIARDVPPRPVALDAEVRREYHRLITSAERLPFPFAPAALEEGGAYDVRSLLARVEAFAASRPSVFPRVRADQRDGEGHARVAGTGEGVPQDVRDFVEAARDFAEFLRQADAGNAGGVVFSACTAPTGLPGDATPAVHYVQLGFGASPTFDVAREIPRAPAALAGLSWNPSRDGHAWIFATQGRVIDPRVTLYTPGGAVPGERWPHAAGPMAFPTLIHAYRRASTGWARYESVAAGGEGSGVARVDSIVEIEVPALVRDARSERRGGVVVRLRFEGAVFPAYLPGLPPAWEE